MRARHYVKGYGVEQCLETYANRQMLPEIDEMQQWCNAEVRFNKLLGLSSKGTRGMVLSQLMLLVVGVVWSLF